jgi:hypothetical protein
MCISTLKKIALGNLVLISMTLNNCLAMGLTGYFTNDIANPSTYTSLKYKSDSQFDQTDYASTAIDYFSNQTNLDLANKIKITLQKVDAEILNQETVEALQLKTINKDDLENSLKNLESLWTGVILKGLCLIELFELKERIANLHDYLIYEINTATNTNPAFITKKYLQTRDDNFFKNMRKYIRESGQNPSKHVDKYVQTNDSDGDSDSE